MVNTHLACLRVCGTYQVPVALELVAGGSCVLFAFLLVDENFTSYETTIS